MQERLRDIMRQATLKKEEKNKNPRLKTVDGMF